MRLQAGDGSATITDNGAHSGKEEHPSIGKREQRPEEDTKEKEYGISN